MGLDRTELAARLAEADWRNPRAEPLPLGEWGRTLVAYADDLIAALALTPPVAGPCPGEDARDDAEARKRIAAPCSMATSCGYTCPVHAPVAPKSEAAKYEPRVGDVVRFKDSVALWVVDGRVPSNRYFTVGITDAVKGSRGCCDPHELTYVRESTDAEKRLAGLPSPEATRPTPWEPKPGDVFRFSHHPDDTYRVVRFDKGYIEAFEGVTGIGKGVLYEGDEHMVAAVVPVFVSPPPAPVEPAKGEAKYDVLAIRDAILRECPYGVSRKDLEDYHAMAIAKAVIGVLTGGAS